eukprot:TRINITY_DN340_c0_g1_i1.p1 TRINITY_DN340_c0_g1~~TRINITY_DN340_c0_g1_i1.p1  ORF type:complete len:659 (+),score=214.45 TRINITY_DN340_c0_g1_i1:77-1978(+)
MAVLLALTACATAGTVHSAPYLRATPSAFQAWMSTGGEGPVDGTEPMHEIRLKIARRVAQFAADRLKDVDSIYSVYSWVARASGLDVGSLHDDLVRLSQQDTVSSFVKAAHEASKKTKAALGMRTEKLQSDEYKYFGFIPELKGNALPGSPSVEWSNRCCKRNTATATWSADRTEVTVELEASGCDVLHVGDFYLLATTEGVHPLTVNDLSKKATVVWKVHETNSSAVMYDLTKKGIRIFAFKHDEAATLVNVLDTIELFLQPEVGRYPDYPTDAAMARNVKFVAEYTQLKPVMEQRTSRDPLDIDTDLIQTGDFFGIIRLDGLDPMLAWAMGSTTGHTTIAMRDAEGKLHVCESTAVGSYWPTNGIQCNPWDTWIKQATQAGFNLVWAPLDPEQRAKLDAEKMWAFFNETSGFDYGYNNMLWGWVDTEANNYPCLPPDYATCLTWDIMEVLFAVGHRLLPQLGDRLVVQAWNHRVNSTGLTPDEVFMRAETVLNISSASIPTIVEQDSWRYNTTRNGVPAVGRSMVCCVFVCHMWKAGGLFGDADVNCGELTNLDDYSLGIFNKALTGENRPNVCKEADPENELCQLVGPYTLNLNHFNEGKVYSGMAEHCPSWNPGVGPDYWGTGKQQQTC